jgi:hypothetical protein
MHKEDGTIRNFVTLNPLDTVLSTEVGDKEARRSRNMRGETRNYTEFFNGKNSVALLRQPYLQRKYNRVRPGSRVPISKFLT